MELLDKHSPSFQQLRKVSMVLFVVMWFVVALCVVMSYFFGASRCALAIICTAAEGTHFVVFTIIENDASLPGVFECHQH
jgi:hypothetical protein